MKYFNRLYYVFSKAFPKKLVEKTNMLLVQAGYFMDSRLFLGFMLFFSVSVASLFFFFGPLYLPNILLLHVIAGLIGFVLSLFLFYFVLVDAAEKKAKKIEEILPSALQIISANLRAGMTLENSFWSAARPEFGIFRDEISRVSADTFSGITISKALESMSKRVRSEVLDRAIKLITQGIRLGGEMVQLLDEVAEDIRTSQQLKKEISRSTLTYVIFIIFASVIISPILFSVSVFYAQVNEEISMKQVSATSDISSAGNIPFQNQGLFSMSSSQATEDRISSQDIYWFAVVSIFITNLFGALILGVIQTGKWTSGVKTAPIFIIGALLVFFLGFTGITSLLGSFFN
ncbi:MAG: type II secretion system F family protein [Candidatus Micrarchaeota archaeon]